MIGATEMSGVVMRGGRSNRKVSSMKAEAVKKDQGKTAATVLRAVLCLGAIAAVSGCELIYFPVCVTDCNAAAGNDSYGQGAY